MYGLPPTNPAPTVHPSCRAQLPNAANIPGLDMDFRKAGSENGDGTSSDGDFHSNHTTPMNYMRRSTPTNQTRKADMLQQSLVHHDHDEGHFQMENDLSALRYSLSADSVDSSYVNRFLSAPQQSDNASEATAEPFNHYREAQKGVPIRISAPANDTDLSMSALSLGPSTGGEMDKESEKEDGLVAGLQGLSFQSKLNEGSRTYSIGESYELLGERADLGAASDFPSAFPAPRDREGYSGDTITPVAHHNSGTVPPQAPRSQRSTPNATPTHYAQMQAQQQALLQGQQGQYAPARPGLPMPPPQQQQGMMGRRAEPYQAQQRMPPQHGGYSEDPYAQVTGLAALAMDSLEGPNQNQGPNSQHLVSQRSPTHAQGYYGNQQHGQPQGQGQHPAQGYATASRYGEVVRTPAPYHAGYGQQPPQPQYQAHGQHGAQYGGYGAQQGMGVGMGPGAGMPGAPSNLIYQVQFKRGVRSFTLSPRANFAVKERDFVVVEADRGEDIGIVVEILDMMAFMERRMNTPRPPPQQQQDGEDQNVCCILRLATLHERQQLPDKFHTEKDIVQSCNELATYGFGLPIMVYDAELQFDRRKLTIYYDCSVRIDFRDFVRQLYATYKARIWMKKICPQIPPDVQPFAAMALATGVQFSQAAGAMPGGAGGHPSGHMGGY